MPSKIIIRQKHQSDNDAVAALIRDSLNVWYRKNRGFDAVVPSHEAASIYTRVYDALDPECCVVAEDVESGRLAGSCFYHPRPTHVSLGIMTVSPEYFGQKVSSKLLAAIVELERRLRGIDRAKDYKFFIENASGIWGVSVLVDDATGALRGVMCSVRDPGCAMVGPGVAVDEESAIALVTRELNRYAGEWSPIVLVPTNAPILRLQMYAYGGRNTETHVAQSLGEALVASGVAIPTFMPETA